MVVEWYYAQDGRQFGPVPDEEIRHIIALRELRPDDLVWHDGLDEWTPAAHVPGLLPPELLPDTQVVEPDEYLRPYGAEDGNGRGPLAPPPQLKSAAADPLRPTEAGEREALAPAAKATGAAAKPSPAADAPPRAAFLEFHPLLALALAVCTCGLFSLWYAWSVSVNYTRWAKRRADSRGRPLGKVRHPIWVFAFSYLTLGFYFCYWAFQVIKECRAYTGRKELSPRTELVLMLLVPPYAVYVVIFHLPGWISRARRRAGLPEGALSGPAYAFLNPCLIIGLPFLAMHYQDSLNEVWLAAP